MVSYEYNNFPKISKIEEFINNIANSVFGNEEYNIKVVLLNSNNEGICSEDGQTIYLQYKQLKSACLNNQTKSSNLDKRHNRIYLKNIVYHEFYHNYNKKILSDIFNYIDSLKLNNTYSVIIKNFIDEYWTVYKSNLYAEYYSGAIEELSYLRNNCYISMIENMDVLSRACGEYKYYTEINNIEFIFNKLKSIVGEYKQIFQALVKIIRMDIIKQRKDVIKLLLHELENTTKLQLNF